MNLRRFGLVAGAVALVIILVVTLHGSGNATSFPAPGQSTLAGLSLRQRGPDVVNGDGDRTGFSVVETGTDQVRADAGQHGAALAGYVSLPGRGDPRG
ncbi:MAG TPA: hypothetical protein VGM53_02380 [Streptosporangiaceae bacterium]